MTKQESFQKFEEWRLQRDEFARNTVEIWNNTSISKDDKWKMISNGYKQLINSMLETLEICSGDEFICYMLRNQSFGTFRWVGEYTGSNNFITDPTYS